MNELKEDLLIMNKILSKYIYKFDNNLGKPNLKYLNDDKMRFPVSMAHRNIEFALNYLIDNLERNNLKSEIKSMRSKDDDDIEIQNCNNEEL